MKKALWSVIMLVAAFGAGYGWMFFQHRSYRQSADETLRRMEGQLTGANNELRLARLPGQLGSVLVEVERDNFGNAKDDFAKFCNDAGAAAAATQDEALRKRLQSVLQRRGEVTAFLDSRKPETAATLRRMFADLAGR